MSGWPGQVLGAVLLVGSLWLGYRYWCRGHDAPVGLQAHGLLLLIVLTCWGGLLGSIFWWLGVPGTFSWTLPPLGGRMLAAAGVAFGVTTVLVLRRPTRRRVRLFLILLAVYLTPLVAAILILHLDRFHFGAMVTYDFFAIAAGMAIAALWYLWRQPPLMAEPGGEDAPTRPIVAAWLGIVAVVTGAWGQALFASDRGPLDLIWVWPGDPLTSRLIGVMLLAIAAGAVACLRHHDNARLMLATALTYGVGIALASLWNGLAGRPVPSAYVIVFGLIALGSTAFLTAERLAVSRPTHAPAD